MFLITTPDKRFWKTDEPVLFLGEWCKIFSQRDVWKKLDYEVLPYHWDDRRKLYQDYLYLDNLCEQMLIYLAEYLNKIHSVNYSVRYWRIIIGPWLYYFIQTLSDRYHSIIAAEKCRKVTNTLVGNYKRGCYLPKDFVNGPAMLVSDDYNHYLYSRIIEFTNRMPFDVCQVEPSCDTGEKCNTNKKHQPFVKSVLKKMTELYGKNIPDQFNKIVFASSSLSRWDLIKLQLALGQFPYLSLPSVESSDTDADWDLRGRFNCDLNGNEFEKLLVEIIKEQIPSVYLEGYGEMNRVLSDVYPRKPKVIFNSTAFHANDAFKIWAAYHAERGVKFVGIQHGGLYGSGLWFALEDHERRIYDRFYTWGWEEKNNDRIKPLSAARVNTVKRHGRTKKMGRILMALATMPRYSYQMYSSFISASGTLAYFDDQYSFVKALPKACQKLLLVRLYHLDWDWSQKDRWLDKFPEIECYFGETPFIKQLEKSRLFIGTYNATTYLETFAANFPTVLFWNPAHWELRPSAQPYFDELKRVGILHDSPESAATKVSEIYEDPMAWWQQPEIQEAKKHFICRFAKTSDNWRKEWKDELLDIAGKKRVI